jgi:hypothetical protein
MGESRSRSGSFIVNYCFVAIHLRALGMNGCIKKISMWQAYIKLESLGICKTFILCYENF